MRKIIQHPTNGYGRMTRGKTASAFGPRKGSKPAGRSIAVKAGRR